MKQTLQLRLGQHLTMTPQLQQAIRLLQLSTLDLRQEIQEALDSNLMLETEEEGYLRDQTHDQEASHRNETEDGFAESGEDLRGGGGDEEQELDPERYRLSEDLPVDSDWGDLYDNYLPGAGGARDSEETDFLAQVSRATSLHDHLLWQLNLTPFSPTDQVVALALLDAINEDGYLTTGIEDIHAGLGDPNLDLDEVLAVLHRIQDFDPPGTGARNLQECLLIQLRQLPADSPHRDNALRLCEQHFDLLANQDWGPLKRRLQWTDEDLTGIMALLRSLHPRPGSLVAEVEPQYVTPDVFVTRRNGAWHVELNPEAMPRLRVNPDYAKLIRRADQSDDNTCLKNHLQEARWFIKSLTSRNETVLRVATKIVELQRGFLEHGEEAMKPLVLRDVADALEMHESTVSRVTTQKYMYTPRGTFEFKYFFSSHVSTSTGGEASATAIRALIKKLVAAEPPGRPLSDDRIAKILEEQGIQVARRTVAKYREGLGIPTSIERKRLF